MLLVSKPSAQTGASRTSRLFPGTRLAHGDFHNHTLISDGAGDPAAAFDSMRRSGLDVAAITDHALYPGEDPMPESERLAHGYVRSLSNAGWRQIAELAEQANQDGSFVALRGFEWTSPRLGHMNVWFSTHWTGTLSTRGYRSTDATFATIPPDAIERAGGTPLLQPDGAPMHTWHAWLQRAVDDGGGLDGLVGFNHPDREPERFDGFAMVSSLHERLVSMEIFNREDDYLLRGVAVGNRSPLVECLEAGWRVGLIGVSDDHSANWGFSEGYGRTGLWVRELTREGVREALLARRVFATRERGFRLDVSADGVRMGGCLLRAPGSVRVVVDLDGGPGWAGRRLSIQALCHGPVVPEVKWDVTLVAGDTDQPACFEVDLVPQRDRWLVIRVSDPDAAERGQHAADFGGYGRAIAYSSPIFLRAPFDGNMKDS